jgi:hypothetical protein
MAPVGSTIFLIRSQGGHNTFVFLKIEQIGPNRRNHGRPATDTSLGFLISSNGIQSQKQYRPTLGRKGIFK